MCKKKREKKRLNCFCFFLATRPLFLSFLAPASPTPSAASVQPPPPSPFLWGRVGPQGARETVQGKGDTQEGETERHAGHRQQDRALGGRGSPSWGSSGQRGTRERGAEEPPCSPHPSCCPPARTGAPGEGVQCLPGPGRPSQPRAWLNSFPSAGLTQVQLCPPSPPRTLKTQRTQTEGSRARQD